MAAFMKRPRYYILDEDNVPQAVLSVTAWGRWFERNGNRRRVAETETIDDDYSIIRVSTVFLGLDHAFPYFTPTDGNGRVSVTYTPPPPILFETMIFGGAHDGYQERYATWAAAEEGHRRAVAMTREVWALTTHIKKFAARAGCVLARWWNTVVSYARRYNPLTQQDRGKEQ